MDSKFLDDLNRRMKELVEASPARDIERNLRAFATGAFSRLDLVTREEFDVQQEVLKRARKKIEQLEAKVAALEARQEKKA